MLNAIKRARAHASRTALWLLVTSCVAGACAIWSSQAQAAKEPVAAGATVSATDSCNVGAIDPNESVTVVFSIRNAGTTNIGTLKATLLATGGVTSPSGQVTVGSLNAGVTKTATFTFTSGNLACGATLVASLSLLDNTTPLGTISYNLLVGKLLTLPFSSGNLALPIPDDNSDGIAIPITVPDLGVIAGVKASLRLNHTFDSDLYVDLIHPDGTVISLIAGEGSDGDNFGTGNNDCSGTLTVLDDNASTAIAAAVAPFAGSFQPEEPLAAFKGKSSKGTWKLRVADVSLDDVGTIGCFKLELQKAACCGAEIRAWTPVSISAESALPANGVPDPGETLTMSFPLINLGASSTTNVVATLQASGGVTSPSAAQAYGALAVGGPAVARSFTFTTAGICGGTLTPTFALQDGATNLGTISFPMRLGVIQSSTQAFADGTPILIPANQGSPEPGVAAPYPSTINVSGMAGTVGAVTVTLSAFNHSFPSDVDVMVVGPTGRKMVIMSGAGAGENAVDAELVFDDTAPTGVPSVIESGTYRPTSFNSGLAFAPPAPSGPYLTPAPAGAATLTSAFAGQSPNGDWSLYALDEAFGDNGYIANGWAIAITSETSTCSGSATAPNPPTGATATGGNAQASVSFNPPVNNGGSAITGYTVTSNPAGGVDSNAGSTATTHVVTGLTNGVAYTFTVTATNAIGTSAPSAPSNSVIPATVPNPPTGATATGGNAQASVSFTAPVNNGGSAITGYTVISNPAGGVDSNAGSTATTHVVTGLTNGVAYTFTVTATNAKGTSAPSAPSNSVTPSATSATLTVSLSGAGTGTVVSNVAGINCPGDCTQTYPAGTPVVLTATATGGSVFTGWLGGCTGTSATCNVTVNSATTASATFAAPGTVATLDVDLSTPNTKYDALTDGLLVVRYLLGLSGTALTNGALGPTAARTTPAAISGYLTDIKPFLDVDGNGQADALTDGLLIVRGLFGVTGPALTNGALGPGATRTTPEQIQTYLQGLKP